MSRKLLWALSLLIVASMVLVACQPAAPAVPTDLKTLRINLGTYPDIIDPQKSSFVNEIAHLNLIYEGLTRLDGALATVPGAAESWEYNADATKVTFKLRKDLKYSDGTLLNAKRFEYSLLRNIDPATAGEYAGITDEILARPNGAALISPPPPPRLWMPSRPPWASKPWMTRALPAPTTSRKIAPPSRSRCPSPLLISTPSCPCG